MNRRSSWFRQGLRSRLPLRSERFLCMRGFPIAERLKFFHQILAAIKPVDGQCQLEGENRGPIMNDARIVALEMLHNPCPKVLRIANINPEGAEQTVDSGASAHCAGSIRVEIEICCNDFPRTPHYLHRCRLRFAARIGKLTCPLDHRLSDKPRFWSITETDAGKDCPLPISSAGSGDIRIQKTIWQPAEVEDGDGRVVRMGVTARWFGKIDMVLSTRSDQRSDLSRDHILIFGERVARTS